MKRTLGVRGPLQTTWRPSILAKLSCNFMGRHTSVEGHTVLIVFIVPASQYKTPFRTRRTKLGARIDCYCISRVSAKTSSHLLVHTNRYGHTFQGSNMCSALHIIRRVQRPATASAAVDLRHRTTMCRIEVHPGSD